MARGFCLAAGGGGGGCLCARLEARADRDGLGAKAGNGKRVEASLCWLKALAERVLGAVGNDWNELRDCLLPALPGRTLEVASLRSVWSPPARGEWLCKGIIVGCEIVDGADLERGAGAEKAEGGLVIPLAEGASMGELG